MRQYTDARGLGFGSAVGGGASLIGALLFCWPLAAAEVQRTVNPDTGLLTWKVEDRGLSLELIQLQPDFVRATYSARGLPSAVTEQVAGFCVFGTIARNTSNARVSYRVADWRYVTPDGKQHRLKTKTEWVDEWRRLGVKFAWSILPDDQAFEVGDWSQGFTTVDLPPESSFDLVYSWRVQGDSHVRTIEDLSCAPETLPVE